MNAGGAHARYLKFKCRDCAFFADPRAHRAMCTKLSQVRSAGQAICVEGRRRTTPIAPAEKEETVPKKWTMDDVEFLKRHAHQGHMWLAEKMERTPASIQQFASKQGIGLGKNAEKPTGGGRACAAA